MFCTNCGKEIDDNAVVCVHCGCATQNMGAQKSLLITILLWLILGGLGAHRFYLGDTKNATTMLILYIVGWLTCWIIIGIIPLLIVGIWWLIDIINIVTGKLGPADGSKLV